MPEVKVTLDATEVNEKLDRIESRLEKLGPESGINLIFSTVQANRQLDDLERRLEKLGNRVLTIRFNVDAESKLARVERQVGELERREARIQLTVDTAQANREIAQLIQRLNQIRETQRVKIEIDTDSIDRAAREIEQRLQRARSRPEERRQIDTATATTDRGVDEEEFRRSLTQASNASEELGRVTRDTSQAVRQTENAIDALGEQANDTSGQLEKLIERLQRMINIHRNARMAQQPAAHTQAMLQAEKQGVLRRADPLEDQYVELQTQLNLMEEITRREVARQRAAANLLDKTRDLVRVRHQEHEVLQRQVRGEINAAEAAGERVRINTRLRGEAKRIVDELGEQTRRIAAANEQLREQRRLESTAKRGEQKVARTTVGAEIVDRQARGEINAAEAAGERVQAYARLEGISEKISNELNKQTRRLHEGNDAVRERRRLETTQRRGEREVARTTVAADVLEQQVRGETTAAEAAGRRAAEYGRINNYSEEIVTNIRKEKQRQTEVTQELKEQQKAQKKVTGFEETERMLRTRVDLIRQEKRGLINAEQAAEQYERAQLRARGATNEQVAAIARMNREIRQFERASRSIKKAEEHLNFFQKQGREFSRTIIRVARFAAFGLPLIAAVRNAYELPRLALQGMLQLTRSAVEYSAQVEVASRGMGVLIDNIRQAGQEQEGFDAERFAQSLQAGDDAYQRILIRSTQVLGNAEEHMGVTQLVLGYSKDQEASLNERLEASARIAHLGRLLGVQGQNLVKEARQVFELETKRGQQILNALGIDFDRAKSLKEQGKWLTEFLKLTESVMQRSAVLANTWEQMKDSSAITVKAFQKATFADLFEGGTTVMGAFRTEMQGALGDQDRLAVGLNLTQDELRQFGKDAAATVQLLIQLSAEFTGWVARQTSGISEYVGDYARERREREDPVNAIERVAGSVELGADAGEIREIAREASRSFETEMDNLFANLDIKTRERMRTTFEQLSNIDEQTTYRALTGYIKAIDRTIEEFQGKGYEKEGLKFYRSLFSVDAARRALDEALDTVGEDLQTRGWGGGPGEQGYAPIARQGQVAAERARLRRLAEQPMSSREDVFTGLRAQRSLFDERSAGGGADALSKEQEALQKKIAALKAENEILDRSINLGWTRQQQAREMSAAVEREAKGVGDLADEWLRLKQERDEKDALKQSLLRIAATEMELELIRDSVAARREEVDHQVQLTALRLQEQGLSSDQALREAQLQADVKREEAIRNRLASTDKEVEILKHIVGLQITSVEKERLLTVMREAGTTALDGQHEKILANLKAVQQMQAVMANDQQIESGTDRLDVVRYGVQLQNQGVNLREVEIQQELKLLELELRKQGVAEDRIRERLQLEGEIRRETQQAQANRQNDQQVQATQDRLQAMRYSMQLQAQGVGLQEVEIRHQLKLLELELERQGVDKQRIKERLALEDTLKREEIRMRRMRDSVIDMGDAFKEVFKGIVAGTRDLDDIFEGLGEKLLAEFADKFLFSKKNKFDIPVQTNIFELFGQGGVLSGMLGESGSILGGLFGGNFNKELGKAGANAPDMATSLADVGHQARVDQIRADRLGTGGVAAQQGTSWGVMPTGGFSPRVGAGALAQPGGSYDP